MLVDDGRGDAPLRPVVEITGDRREEATERKATMDSYRVSSVHKLGTVGRVAFAERTDTDAIEFDSEGAEGSAC